MPRRPTNLAGRYLDFLAEEGYRPRRPTATLLERSLDALRHAAAQVFEKRVPPEHLDA